MHLHRYSSRRKHSAPLSATHLARKTSPLRCTSIQCKYNSRQTSTSGSRLMTPRHTNNRDDTCSLDYLQPCRPYLPEAGNTTSKFDTKQPRSELLLVLEHCSISTSPFTNPCRELGVNRVRGPPDILCHRWSAHLTYFVSVVRTSERYFSSTHTLRHPSFGTLPATLTGRHSLPES